MDVAQLPGYQMQQRKCIWWVGVRVFVAKQQICASPRIKHRIQLLQLGAADATQLCQGQGAGFEGGALPRRLGLADVVTPGRQVFRCSRARRGSCCSGALA